MANMENEPTRTGKRLEGLAVEDLEGEQASVTSKNRIANAAKEVWMRMKGVLRKDLSVSGNPTGWKIGVKELLKRCRLLFPLPE
jgi:hypothetical protein